MADKDTNIYKRILEDINFAGDLEQEYSGDDFPLYVHQCAANFMDRLIEPMPRGHQTALKTLRDKMTGNSGNKNNVARLFRNENGIPVPAVETNALLVPIDFSRNLDGFGGDELIVLAGVWLYLWSNIYPENAASLRDSQQIAMAYRDASGYFSGTKYSLNEKQSQTEPTSIEDRITYLNKEIEGLRNDNHELKIEISVLDKQTKEDIASAVATVKEGVALIDTKELWNKRETANKTAFKYSAIAVITILIAGPCAVWYFSGDMIGFLNPELPPTTPNPTPETPDANLAKGTTAALIASQITRLIFLSLPIVVYFYLVRLVVRFSMRSMILMDDAIARQTMLDTYLHLVQKDTNATDDRPIILEALFRRTPGHGADTIQPPNLTEILKVKALAGSAAKAT